jgi:hypothetical protein
MPIHDWTRVDAGLFHAFHQRWISALCDALNTGGLPPDYFALPDQNIRGPIPDVLTLQLSSASAGSSEGTGGLAVATVPPRVRPIRRKEAEIYAGRANRITVRHRHGDVVSVIEIVSPGNKSSQAEFDAFVEKSQALVKQGVHLLIIDLFPPGRRDPEGIHVAIWGEYEDEDPKPPADKLLTVASYDAGPDPAAYVYPLGVGDVIPDVPLFLRPEYYVPASLEATYLTTWKLFPAALKGLLDGPSVKELS